jgi:hypothetical protein
MHRSLESSLPPFRVGQRRDTNMRTATTITPSGTRTVVPSGRRNGIVLILLWLQLLFRHHGSDFMPENKPQQRAVGAVAALGGWVLHPKLLSATTMTPTTTTTTRRFGRQRQQGSGDDDELRRDNNNNGGGGGKKKKMQQQPRILQKENLPTKICLVCGRPFSWRKKWERCWEEVTTCSKRCNSERRQQRQQDVQT